MKNPKTCRLQIGDRVTQPLYPGGMRFGTLIQRRGGYPSFGVQWDGNRWTSWNYRDQILKDTTPTEPEEYESFFV